MKIVSQKSFVSELSEIVDFIAKDSTARARQFKADILAGIKKIAFMPFGYPKNRYFDDESIRNLIFKGYVVAFKIDELNEQIIVFAIYKHNIPKL